MNTAGELVIPCLQVDQEILDEGDYCICVEVNRKSKEYARGWGFEGCGITRGKNLKEADD